LGDSEKKAKKDGVPSSLKRGRTKSTKPRSLTPEQYLFCAKRALGLSVEGAGAEAGVSYSTAWKWNRMDRVQAEIEKNREKLGDDILKREISSYRLNLGHADIEITRVASMQKPHKFRGYSDKTKAVELIYRRLKAIEPQTRATATAVSGAVAGAVVGGTNMKERYKALWLIRKEQQLERECEKEAAEADLPAQPSGD